MAPTERVEPREGPDPFAAPSLGPESSDGFAHLRENIRRRSETPRAALRRRAANYPQPQYRQRSPLWALAVGVVLATLLIGGFFLAW